MPVNIYPFFSFSFDVKKENSQIVHAIFIFKPLGKFDLSVFSDFLAKELLKHGVVTQVVFAVPCVESDIYKLIEKDETVSNTMQRRDKTAIQMVTYEASGKFKHLEWLQSGGIDIPQEVICKEGMNVIEKMNPCIIQEAPPNCVFKKPSDERHRFFIRGSQLLGSDTQVSFLALLLLPYFNPEYHDFIYIDSMSISPLVYKIIAMKLLLSDSRWQPQVLSFHSYDGLSDMDNRPSYPDKTMVLISASSSGNMTQKIISEWKVPPSSVITLLSYQEAKENSILMHKVEEPQVNNVDKLTPIEIRGEYFIPVYKKVSRFLIKHSHVPPYLKDLMSKLYDQDIFQAHKNDQSIWVEPDNLLQNQGFNEWFNETLHRRAPLLVSHVIYDNASSEDLADKVVDFYSDKRDVIKLKASDILNTEDTFFSVIVVSSVVKTGATLLSISRDLRSKVDNKKASITYFVGLHLAENAEKEKSFLSSLTYSSARNFKHNFEVWFHANIPNTKNNPWQEELDFLQLDEYENYNEIKERICQLSSTSGLTKDCFWPSLKNGENLGIQKDFVFWDKDFIPSNAVNNANVFFTISCILQNARNLSKGYSLKESEYESVCLSPECFARFNDGVIQASLLRASLYSELNYSLDKETSSFMTDMIVKMINHQRSTTAEALPEFVLALSIGKLKLVRSDIKRIKAESSKLPGYLKVMINHIQ